MPRRSLLIVADSHRGGVGPIVIGQANWFQRMGWEVQVAWGTRPDPGWHGHVAQKSFRLPQSTRQLRSIWQAGGELRTIRREFGPDVVHIHGARSFAAWRLRNTHPVFLSHHVRGPVPGDPPGYRQLREVGLAVLPKLTIRAISGAPNAVRGWRYLPHASLKLETMSVLEFPDRDSIPTFLWMARLAATKHPDRFVRAISEVAKRRPVRGILAGAGPRDEEMRELITSLNAPVDVVGHSDPVELLRDSWATVHLSDHEGMPLAVQEAMWCGRAAVASDHPGLIWMVGDAGLIVRSQAEAVQAIERLCDHSTASLYSQRAASRAHEILTYESPWPEMLEMYGDWLDRLPGDG